MISKIYKGLDKRQLFTLFFNTLNSIQKNNDSKLRDREIEAIVEFMILDEKYKYDRFSFRSKKKVLESIRNNPNSKPMSMPVLQQMINNLKIKGMIREDEDKVKYLNNKLNELLNKDEIEFNIKFSTKND